ncbi:MAG: hypothetical protein EOR81_32525 [Mesorhizobium sp.]|nr:MAG: hypothetical protein EOR81_32525 [Mesorhizobium sp.]
MQDSYSRWRGTWFDEDHVSVSIPSYNFPHSIVDRSTNVERGQQMELVGNVTHIDEKDGKVTIHLGPPGTVDVDKVRLVEKYRAPKRKKPLRDMVD